MSKQNNGEADLITGVSRFQIMSPKTKAQRINKIIVSATTAWTTGSFKLR